MQSAPAPERYADIDGEAWDALVPGDAPFLRHAWLATLERTGVAAPRAGWWPRPVVVRNAVGDLVAAAPGWLKRDSFGEFVYDFGLAEAASRAGLAWYPKLVVGVPFTPVTGPRLLAVDATARASLLDALLAPSPAHVGVHVLFPPDTPELAASPAWFERHQFQVHWVQRGWPSFEAWLADAFTSKNRSEVRRERKKAREGLVIREVHDPGPDLLRRIGDGWARHVRRFGQWGRAPLAPALADLGAAMPGAWTATVAEADGQLVAATLDVVTPTRRYGRIWCAFEERPFLHFEMCLYRQVERAIETGALAFEPGHGGEHKLGRGFEPVITRSYHHLAHPGLHDGIARWAALERERVAHEVEALRQGRPLPAAQRGS